MKTDKNLIILFSHSGNTKKIAELMNEYIAAEVVNIEAVVPYPKGFQAAIEEMSRQNKGKILPDFKKVNLNMQSYDTVFLGYPVWDSRLPPVVRSFLRENDFRGITIAPFNTHKGYGTGKSVNEIREFAEGATVLEVLSISENEIASELPRIKVWLEESEFI
ncbi:flavodoxin family protein [Chryseobacterium sp. T20]|uniref:flavodoxin family protein n=1 Tax=Chryseobacterium sp. T20 TaxID=3395375 RepID=UPI0039BD6D81